MIVKTMEEFNCKIEYVTEGIEEPELIISFFTKNGEYIGDIETLRQLIFRKYNVKF